MPILDVEIVLLPEESVRPGLAAEIADRCGQVFNSPPGSTWVKIHLMPCDHYAENGGGPNDGAFPIFVSVLKARLPAPDLLRAEVDRLTAAVAGRPIAQRCTSTSFTFPQAPGAWHSAEGSCPLNSMLLSSA